MPVGGATFAEALRMAAEVFQTLKKVLSSRKLSTGVGDEGGFAPDLPSHDAALDLIVAAIEQAGYKPGRTWSSPWTRRPRSFSIKPPANMSSKRETAPAATPQAMTDYYRDLTARYPIVSIEDGLAEDDWDGWVHLTKELGAKLQLVGDDIFVTNVPVPEERHRTGRGQRHSHQAEPDRHGHRDPGRHQSGRAPRLPGRHFAPLRGDGGHLHRRPGGGHEHRPDQDRLGLPLGAHRQVQPPPDDRSGTGPRGPLPGRPLLAAG